MAVVEGPSGLRHLVPTPTTFVEDPVPVLARPPRFDAAPTPASRSEATWQETNYERSAHQPPETQA
jgi:hypothetical protein